MSEDEVSKEKVPIVWTPEPWTKWGRQADPRDPLIAPPPWVTKEISDELGKIGAGDSRRRRRTIIMVADAVASGNREIQDVLQDPLTVGTSVWYQRIRREPQYEHVWRTCLDAAQRWYDQMDARRIVRRAMRAEETRDEMVSLTKDAVRELASLLLDPETPAAVKERVAFGLLDRADEQTATKSSAQVTVAAQQGPSMRDLMRDKRNRSVVEAEGGEQVTIPSQPRARLAVSVMDDSEAVPEYAEPEFEDLDEIDGTVGD